MKRREGTTTREQELTAEAVKKDCVHLPETVFPLGCEMEYVDDRIKEIDRSKHLGMGSILDATPLFWAHLHPFHIARRMVTSGQYLRFLQADMDEERGTTIFDDPELWNVVWHQTGFAMEEVQTPYLDAEGELRELPENYAGCVGFVDAYVQSIKSEFERIFLQGGGDDSSGSEMALVRGQDGTKEVRVPMSRVLKRLFALIKHKLSASVLTEEDDPSMLMSPEEGGALEFYREQCPEKARSDIDLVVREARKIYGRQVERRYRQAFQQGKHRIETTVFLERFAGEVGNQPDLDDQIPLHRILFPRNWAVARAPKRSKFGGRTVPWEELPVTSITLYEAVAYCLWLGHEVELEVGLPNEAQYERVSSWGANDPPRENGTLLLDPRKKAIFPWQEHNPNDFNYFFGSEGRQLSNYYEKDKKRYQKLVEDTARLTPTGQRIEQLEGFGWHWTCERFDELERKYQRFSAKDCPVFAGRKCVELDQGKERAIVVYDYQPQMNARFSYFALKGSPEVLGGPGLTTRRYAAYPLRGYDNVGFRYIVREE